MGIWDLVQIELSAESLCARLAVQDIQHGRDASFFIERAGRHWAVRYDYEATLLELKPTQDARWASLRARGSVAV